MTKRKPNIQPKDIGGLYIDSDENVYRLTSCESEPRATMTPLSKDVDMVATFEKPISQFADFIRLKPVRPLIKAPAPHKVRSDKGTTRAKKPEQVSSPVTIEPAKWPESGASLSEEDWPTPAEIWGIGKKRLTAGGLPDVSTFSVSTGKEGEKHILELGGRGVPAKTLRDGVMELFAFFGIDQAYVENAEDSDGKKHLLNILNSGK